jgi:hypothetical protein
MAYEGYNTTGDELTAAVIANDFDLSDDSLEQYGEIAGGMGAAAACTAYGAAAAAPLCKWLGGIIGRELVKFVTGLAAHGSTLEDLVLQTVNDYIKPEWKLAKKRHLAAKVYFTKRDAAIDYIAGTLASGDLDADRAWADAKLTAIGAQAPGDIADWHPDWTTYNDYIAEHAEAMASPSTWFGGELKKTKQLLGLDYATTYDVRWWPHGVPAPPADKVDWHKIGKRADTVPRAATMAAFIDAQIERIVDEARGESRQLVQAPLFAPEEPSITLAGFGALGERVPVDKNEDEPAVDRTWPKAAVSTVPTVAAPIVGAVVAGAKGGLIGMALGAAWAIGFGLVEGSGGYRG